MSKKRVEPKPVWWKNSFFWFAAALAILAIVGIIRGDESIRDPGQVREGGLAIMYLGGAILMLLNGWITHKLSEKQYEEIIEREAETPSKDEGELSPKANKITLKR